LATFSEKLKSRLPSPQEILPVFSTIVFFVFTWALYRMFYQVPAWLYFLSLLNILILTAYVLAFALFESGVMLVFLLFLSFVFPARLYKDKFVAQSAALVALVSIGAVLVQRKIGSIYQMVLWKLIAYPLFFLVGVVLFIAVTSFVFDRFSWFPRFIASIADRLTIFSYVYVPLSLISLAVVIIRNL